MSHHVHEWFRNAFLITQWCTWGTSCYVLHPHPAAHPCIISSLRTWEHQEQRLGTQTLCDSSRHPITINSINLPAGGGETVHPADSGHSHPTTVDATDSEGLRVLVFDSFLSLVDVHSSLSCWDSQNTWLSPGCLGRNSRTKSISLPCVVRVSCASYPPHSSLRSGCPGFSLCPLRATVAQPLQGLFSFSLSHVSCHHRCSPKFSLQYLY